MAGGATNGSYNGYAAPAPAPVSKPGLDGIDAFSIQGFKKSDKGGVPRGFAGQQQQQQQQQAAYNNVPLNQIPAKGNMCLCVCVYVCDRERKR